VAKSVASWLFAVMKICSRVAHNIKDIRHYRGLSQEVLAENAGVSRGYMGKLENAKHSATLVKLEQIGIALEIDPLILLLPRWHERDRLIAFLNKQGGYIDLFQGRSA
jgi:transcriptional regulator with XRE-family HTH domain